MPGTSEQEGGDLVVLQKNCHMKVKAELSKASLLVCLHHDKIDDIAFTDIICFVKHMKIRQVAKRKKKGWLNQSKF